MKRAFSAGGAYNVFKNITSTMSENSETTAMLMSQKFLWDLNLSLILVVFCSDTFPFIAACHVSEIIHLQEPCKFISIKLIHFSRNYSTILQLFRIHGTKRERRHEISLF